MAERPDENEEPMRTPEEEPAADNPPAPEDDEEVVDVEPEDEHTYAE
jgi:hypothetical protein